MRRFTSHDGECDLMQTVSGSGGEEDPEPTEPKRVKEYDEVYLSTSEEEARNYSADQQLQL